MFGFFKNRKKDDHLEKVLAYINSVYVEPAVDGGCQIKYSRRTVEESEENYDFDAVSLAMEEYFQTGEAKALVTELDKVKRKTFTEMLIWHIAKQGKKDSAVYNAAQIDRRLFSKIMSDREYKPSKDTAVALILALQLPIAQAKDLLHRAGYSLSHSNKRDIVIEYFIKEGVYDLMLINDVLYKLGEKKIGR